MPSAPPVVRGFFPLDEELSLLPGPLTPRLVEDLVHRGTWMPFPIAARNLGRFHAVRVTEPSARRWTEKAGAALVAHQTAEVARLVRAEVPPPPGPPLQQSSGDGAMVPVVGGAGTEGTTGAMGPVGEPVREKDRFAVHAQDLSDFSRGADPRTFSPLASRETHRRGTATAGTGLGIVDGAGGEQGFLDDHRPAAVRILDGGHAAEPLAQAGQALVGAGPALLSPGLDQGLPAFRPGQPEKVLAEVRRQITAFGGGDAAREEAQGHLTDREERREQIRDAEFEALGDPIGSGRVESGTKRVVEARLNGAGMHWASAQVHPLVARRAGAGSDRGDQTGPGMHASLRQAPRDRQPERWRRRRDRTPEAICPAVSAPGPSRPPRGRPVCPTLPDASAAPSPSPKRPSPNHPWRRSLIPPDQRRAARSPARTKT